jgi:selenocysteine lyase/cysteine desulfurase
MDFGTPNIVGIAALSAGQNWIETTGIENIYAHEIALAERLVEGFQHIDGVRIYCCESMKNHLSTITVNIEDMDAGDVGIILDVDHNIAVRTGLHCAPLVHQQIGTLEIHGGVRFSIGAFNTEEHIDHAIAAMAEIAEFSRQRVLRTMA